MKKLHIYLIISIFLILLIIIQKEYPKPKKITKEITWFLEDYVPLRNAGAEIVAHTFNKFLINNGYNVNVVGNWEDGIYDGVNCINETNNEKVDSAVENSYLLFSQLKYSKSTVEMGKEKNKKVVLFVHDLFLRDSIIEYKNIIGKSNLLIIFNSVSMKNKYIDDLNYYILNPPVDCSKYITNTNNNYVTLINLNDNKGGNFLIEIAKHMPDIEFLGVEGGYYTQIIDKSVKNILYVPHTSNVKDIYKNTDILLMPSKIETWGRTASEAICSGIPVIANPTEGIKENLQDAGIYIDRNNISDWVNMIRKLKTDRMYYNKISEKCKLHSKKTKEHQMEGLRKRMEA